MTTTGCDAKSSLVSQQRVCETVAESSIMMLIKHFFVILNCMNVYLDASLFWLQPQSPEAVRRFRASLQPDAGRMRVFYR